MGMPVPNTYHKSVEQRHHELNPKVFYYDYSKQSYRDSSFTSTF